jgi:hypothetical protein
MNNYAGFLLIISNKNTLGEGIERVVSCERTLGTLCGNVFLFFKE